MLKEKVLQSLVSEKAYVRIFTMNGYQMRGVIVQADASMLVLEYEGAQKMISVSAISTIEPMSNFKLPA